MSLHYDHWLYDHHVYVLYDRGGNCYIGSTINERRRKNEHFAAGRRYKAGNWQGWHEQPAKWLSTIKDIAEVKMVILETIQKSGQVNNIARRHEWSWRGVAYCFGWNVVDVPAPMQRMRPDSLTLLEELKPLWPLGYYGPGERLIVEV